MSCATAVAVADAIKDENILANVEARCVPSFISHIHLLSYSCILRSSKDLFSALKALQSDPDLSPYILDVRGRGLMVAIEFSSPTGPGPHDPLAVRESPKTLASRVAKRCIEKGMLILTTSVYEVVRFIPPLNVSEEDMKKGCAIFAEAVREVVREG